MTETTPASVASGGEQHVMRTPRAIDIDITARCNLRCSYCYFFDDPARAYSDVPTDDWLRFFGECGRLGVMRVTIAGGEPFIREDLPVLIESIVRNRMRFSILSNGSLITDNCARLLAATKRCDQVQVSIDGSRASVHDVCRGVGAFDGAVRGIALLQAHGIEVTSRMTIQRHNVDDIDATIRFLLDDLHMASVSTNAAGAIGSCNRNAGSVALSAAEYGRAMVSVSRLRERYGERLTAQAGPLASALMWRRMEDARKSGLAAFGEGGALTACGCVWERMAVLADGTMAPCTMLPHLAMGHIGSDDLGEIWRDSPVMRRVRQRSRIPLDSFEFCASCPYIPYCTGNCPGLARSGAGTDEHPSPDGCLREYLRAGGTLAEETHQ